MSSYKGSTQMEENLFDEQSTGCLESQALENVRFQTMLQNFFACFLIS